MMQKRFVKLAEILRTLPTARVIGETDRTVTHPAAIHQAAGPDAISFVGATQNIDVSAGPSRTELIEKIRDTKAGVVICHRNLAASLGDLPGKTLILVDNPRLSFIRILQAFFAMRPPPWGIHPTAVIDSDAVVYPRVRIGPYCVVGKSEIREGTVLHGHVFVYDGCVIGRNVKIYPGCIIGAPGFGAERDEMGAMVKFPQLGGLVIEDDVEIQGLTNVDRGTLGDMVIGEGTKIDTGCHVGHNTTIGKHCFIAAHVMTGGRVDIGDYAHIAPCACFLNGLRIGARAVVGTGALVTKDVPEGAVVMGSPARPADEYKRILKGMVALR